MKTKHDRINGGMKICLACAALLVSCTNPHRYVIEGQLDGIEGAVYLLDREYAPVDSANASAGRFRLAGEVAVPTIGHLNCEQEDLDIFFFLEPGTITISRSGEELPVAAGTPANDAYARYFGCLTELLEELNAPETSDERRNALNEEITRLRVDTYYANVGNVFGALLLQSPMCFRLSGRELLDELAKFPAALQQSELLTVVRTYAERKLAAEEREQAAGAATPDSGTLAE